MGIFDSIKKFIVESDSKLINNSLFKSNTDLLFDKLYRLVKKHSSSDEQTFLIQQNENCISYSIDSLDMIHISTVNEETLKAEIYYILRQKPNYLLKTEIYQYNKNLKDRKLISQNDTVNIPEIEYFLSDSLNALKDFFEKKETCDDIYFVMYDYILEQGQSSKEDTNIKVVKTSKNGIPVFFRICTSEKDIIEFSIATPEYITAFSIINKSTYYTCIEREMKRTYDGKLKVVKEIQESNLKDTFDTLKEFEEIIEQTYTSVKRNKRTNRVNFSKFNNAREIQIPSRVKRIEDNALSYLDLEKIEIPDSVEYIGEFAFRGCKSLNEVKLPQLIKQINKATFRECESLSKLYIPNSVEYIEDSAFERCYSLKEINLPKNLKYIGIQSFKECRNLKSLSLPDSVISIGYKAFYACFNLEKINIPNSVTSIDDFAFYKCYHLKEITLPNSIDSISNGLFRGCSSLKKITIPNSVTSIGYEAFYDCSLGEIILPNSVTFIDEHAFSWCGLEKIVIPNSVVSIEENAFSDCNDVCIYCNRGSYAETFAMENEINFKYI